MHHTSPSLRKLRCKARNRNLLISATNAIPNGKSLLVKNSLGLSLKMGARHLAMVSSWFSSHIFALLSTFVQLCDNARTRKVFGVNLDNFEVNWTSCDTLIYEFVRARHNFRSSYVRQISIRITFFTWSVSVSAFQTSANLSLSFYHPCLTTTTT